MTENGPDRLLAGEVGKPHGLAGEVYVVPISDDPQRFAAGALLLRDDGSVLTVASSKAHGNRLLVRFEEASDRPAAEALRGPLFVSADEARELGENEFWPHDLVGSTVEVEGRRIGEVLEVVPGAAQDLLRVGTAGGDKFVPFVSEIVTEVDVEHKQIVIDPPEGLLD